MGNIIATCISDRKGIQKREVPSVELRVGLGVVGDAHAGNWHRQVSLLAEESVDQMRASLGQGIRHRQGTVPCLEEQEAQSETTAKTRNRPLSCVEEPEAISENAAKTRNRPLSGLSGIDLPPGAFAENLLTRGVELKTLPVGTVLRAGTALLAVTQIGKECHSDCAIKQTAGRCVMPTDGIFAIVLKGGVVSPGDDISIVHL